MLKKITAWYNAHRLEIMVGVMLLLLLFVTALPYMLVSIDSGREGVLWRRFFGGTETDYAFPEGTTLIFPWDKMTIYDIRLRQQTATYDTLSNNGLHIQVGVAFRFHPEPETLPILHKYVGPDYIDVILLPEMGAHVRKVISKYSPEQLYSINRDTIQDDILDSIRKEISVIVQDRIVGTEDVMKRHDYIYVDDILVNSIVLPDYVRSAIESKEQVKQLAFAYDHRIEAEIKEKQRKKIEAEGIRDFQDTISEGISDRYLQWKGIDATVRLAESNNAKVVIIGSAKDGLPIILGSDYTTSPALANRASGVNTAASTTAIGPLPRFDSLSTELLMPTDIPSLPTVPLRLPRTPRPPSTSSGGAAQKVPQNP